MVCVFCIQTDIRKALSAWLDQRPEEVQAFSQLGLLLQTPLAAPPIVAEPTAFGLKFRWQTLAAQRLTRKAHRALPLAHLQCGHLWYRLAWLQQPP